MHSHSAERAFEIHIEEILLMRGRWNLRRNAAIERLLKHRTVIDTAAVTGRVT